MINARLRKRFLQGGFGVGLIGQPVDLTYPYDYLGAGTETLSAVAEGNGAFADVLERSQRPMVILGMGALERPDGAAVLPKGRGPADGLGIVPHPTWGGGGNGVTALHP